MANTRRGKKPAHKRPPKRTARKRAPSNSSRKRRAPRRRWRRSFFLFTIAVALSSLLLWGIVNLAKPAPRRFVLPTPIAAAPTPPVEIDAEDRKQLEKVLRDINPDPAP